jgi:hypothetical protein
MGPQLAQSRPNGQPPAAWLVDIAERLEGVLAEAWERWDATEAVWSGSGSDLLAKPAPAPVVGLWWD